MSTAIKRKHILTAALCAIVLSSSGCMSGLLYKHTTTPIDLNFDETPIAQKRESDSWMTLIIPNPWQYVRFDWGSIAIGEAMKDAGIDTVHYADLETWSILSIFSKQTIRVYGE